MDRQLCVFMCAACDLHMWSGPLWMIKWRCFRWRCLLLWFILPSYKEALLLTMFRQLSWATIALNLLMCILKIWEMSPACKSKLAAITHIFSAWHALMALVSFTCDTTVLGAWYQTSSMTCHAVHPGWNSKQELCLKPSVKMVWLQCVGVLVQCL